MEIGRRIDSVAIPDVAISTASFGSSLGIDVAGPCFGPECIFKQSAHSRWKIVTFSQNPKAIFSNRKATLEKRFRELYH